MKLKLSVLFSLIAWLWVFSGPCPSAADEGGTLNVLFSANVKGELEPCG